MAKPGVMLYFDIRDGLSRLTQAEKGDLLDAIFEFGQYGTEPSLSGSAGIAWAFIRPRLESDDRKYTENIEKRKYATYVRECKKRKQTPLPIERWRREA